MSIFDEITPTRYQANVLAIPENFNVMLCGGRGGAKTTAAIFDILRHCDKYGARARPLIIRESHKGLEELAEDLDHMLTVAYQGGHRHNRQKGVIKLPNGAIISMGILENAKDYRQWQGKSFTYLFVDEAGAIKNNRWVNMLKSNLRAPEGIPLREVRAANPGGVSHAYIHQNHILKAPAWQLYELDSEHWVNAPSTLVDNPHLGDREAYQRRLKAATKGDDALFKAWVTGDWNIARGAYFHLLDEKTHMLPADFDVKVWPHWRPYLAGDWGSAAPCVVYVVGRAPPGNPFTIAGGSFVLLDELAIWDKVNGDVNEGLRWPPGKVAEAIHELCGRWGFTPRGVMDDAMGIEDSLLDYFAKEHNLRLEKPEKARISGWAQLRQAMQNAVDRNGAPGFYASAKCEYFWKTVPYLPRDENRPEDVDTAAADHAADAARYAVMCDYGYGLVSHSNTTLNVIGGY